MMMKMNMMKVLERRGFVLGLAGLGLVACSPGPAPVSESARDPSNPRAAEAALPPAAATGEAPPAEPAAAHSTHQGHMAAAGDAGPAETVYVCPMHPEVTSTKAGEVCPKCNMKLVPKK